MSLGLESDLRQLQIELLANPRKGDVEPGTGGLRKARMADSPRGKGKRSGIRIIYLFAATRRIVYLLFVYSKDETDRLSADQRKQLKAVAEGLR